MIQKLRRSRTGFTLVELIVVIAILAILAGVAIPVYSGYVKKANQAGDLQLLSAVNTAFAAACAEIGVDPTEVSANVSLSGTSGAKTVGSVSVSGVSGFNDAFMRYFAGNEDQTFKQIEVLRYVQPQGIFVGYTSGDTVMISATINGAPVTLSISADDLASYSDSVFGTSETLSSQYLMKSVDTVVDAAAATIASATVFQMYKNAMNTQGISEEQRATIKTAYMNLLEQATGDGIQTYLTSLGYSSDQVADIMTDDNKFSNALVLYSASKLDGLTTDDVMNWFNPDKGGMFGTNPFASTSQPNQAAVQSTLRYAIAMGYAYQDGASLNGTYNASNLDYIRKQAKYSSLDTFYNDMFGAGNWTADGSTVTVNMGDTSVADWFADKTDNMSSSLLTAMVGTVSNSNGFQSYWATDAATSDVSGFLSAMSMISDNTSNINVDSLLNEGYSQTDFVEMLQSIFGS